MEKFGLSQGITDTFNAKTEEAKETVETIAPDEKLVDTETKTDPEQKTETKTDPPAKEITDEKKEDVIDENKPKEPTDPPIDDKKEAQPAQPAQPAVPTEPTEEQIKKFFEAKGRKVEKIDDLFQPEVKEINPYEKISDDFKKALDYHKETGRGLNDFLRLQEDIDAIPLNRMAINFAKKETGMDLSDEDAIAYIESELGIDLSDMEELTATDKIKLNKYVKDYRAELKSDQEKFRLPKEQEQTQNQQVNNVEMVTLEDGSQIAKSVYDKHLEDRKIYTENLKAEANSVAPITFEHKFDNNGVEEIIKFEYTPDKDDEQKSIENAADFDQTIKRLFVTEKGFDYAGFKLAGFLAEKGNLGKVINAFVNKAVAYHTERLMKEQNNVNFGTNRINSKNTDTKKQDIFQPQNGFGVKFEL